MNNYLYGFMDELEKQAKWGLGGFKIIKNEAKALAAGKLHGAKGGDILNMPAKFQTQIGHADLPHTQAFRKGMMEGGEQFNKLNKIQKQRVNLTSKERTQIAKTRLNNQNEIRKTNFNNNLKATSDVSASGTVTPKPVTPTPPPTSTPTSAKLGIGDWIKKNPIPTAIGGGAAVVAGAHVLSNKNKQPVQQGY